MPFVIKESLCVHCGSCASNCPNRAIVRRDASYLATTMCCDCGTCVHFCPMEPKAIGKGKTKTDFDNKKITNALKEKLSLHKGIAAMKYLDKPPEGVPVEDGMNFWCHICGDMFEGIGSPTFFTAKVSSCGGSSLIGIGSRGTGKEEFCAVIDALVVGEGKSYASVDVWPAGKSFFPRFPKVYGGVVIGPLESVKMPDIILFPINAHQLSMISTAYPFDTGDIIRGYGGTSQCTMTVPVPLIENRPVFASGDHGGRSHMRLTDAEMVISFPYKLVPGLIKNLDRTIYAYETAEVS